MNRGESYPTKTTYSKKGRINAVFLTGDQAVIRYGNFIQCVVNFLIIALCIFLCIKLINRFHRQEDKKTKAEDKAEIALLKEIRDELKKK